MKTRGFSIAVMIAATVLLGAFDIYLATNDAPGDTYSEIIKHASERVALLPWGFGLLCGHWFWNGERVRAWWAWPLAGTSLVLAGILQWFDLSHPLVSCAMGLIAGRVAWAMK
jgi:hypothetical protein